MKMKFPLILLAAALMSACATRPPTQDAAPQAAPAATPGTQVVKSIDGTYTGEIVGNVSPASKFAKLKIGMEMSQVHALIKTPDDMQRFESGKRWIPFYFGNDAQRVLTYYEGEGCLTYTGGGVFGGGGGQLIKIQADKSKGCFLE